MAANIKSGKYWVAWANTNALNSTKIDDLELLFKNNVKAFKKALEDAGATVKIKAAKRHPKRAYLFHWAWKIHLDKCKPSDATALAGVDIEWDHGDLAKSKAGAKEMVLGFQLSVPPKNTKPPSLSSNHIHGKAIDMEITWTGTIKVKNKTGTEVSVKFNQNVSANTDLHKVGSSYGVKKLVNDAPHWSFNGH